MSMTIITLLQVIELFIIYTLLTVLIPDLLLHKKYSYDSLCKRFITDFTLGNFYFMNLVFILQLVHISSVYTLIAFTVIPIAAILVIQHKAQLKPALFLTADYMNRIAKGTLGIKTFVNIITKNLCSRVGRLFKRISKKICSHKIEFVFLIGLAAFLCYLYGTNEIVQFGYTASDLPVHNYWINEMSNNNIFAAGVYPFGFHCIIYFIHTVFGIDTYIILRLFSIVQTFYIHLVLYTFIRSICRSSYTAYAGMFLYIAVDLYHENCTIRYLSALPQEYGMLFILPCIYYIFEFFKHQKENAEKKLIVEELFFAALNFSMTISVHFYDTMVAGLFCAAIAVGFAVRFFRPRYFLRIMSALLLALLLGILPMAVAALSGKPMQGSIGWGINILTGKGNSGSANNSTNNSSGNNSSVTSIPNNNMNSATGETSDGKDKEKTDSIQKNDSEQQDNTAVKPSFNIKSLYDTLSENIRINIFGRNGSLFTAVILGCCIFLLLAGIGMCIGRQFDYGFSRISISIFIILLLMLFNSKDMGLPQLMDQNRSRIYLVYMLTILYATVIDFPSAVIMSVFKKEKITNGISLFLGSSVCVAAAILFGIRGIVIMPKTAVLQTNGAVTCLYRIINEHKDGTWTIVSANDELQMINTHGYHYETITLLRYMKYATTQQRVTIPTKYVYFFVEKIPLDYTVSYYGSGQTISSEGAKMKLPENSEINPYKGESRFIVMSKMYYWAESYKNLFSTDMSIYYEDDEFICYRLIQNESSLHSLTIDYGYNQ